MTVPGSSGSLGRSGGPSARTDMIRSPSTLTEAALVIPAGVITRALVSTYPPNVCRLRSCARTYGITLSPGAKIGLDQAHEAPHTWDHGCRAGARGCGSDG